MAKYLFAVYAPATPTEFGPYPSREAMEQAFARTDAFNKKLQQSGQLVFADGLVPGKASVVDGRSGQPTVTDGPYLETTEWLGGFWVVEVADEAAARELAGEASQACGNRVEIRPFQA